VSITLHDIVIRQTEKQSIIKCVLRKMLCILVIVFVIDVVSDDDDAADANADDTGLFYYMSVPTLIRPYLSGLVAYL